MEKSIHRLVISVYHNSSVRVYGILLLILSVSNQSSLAPNSTPSLGKSVNNFFLPYVSKPCPFTLDQIEIIYVRKGYNNYDRLLGTKLDMACSSEIASTDAIWESKPAWSPDGSKIAYLRDGEIYVLELNRLRETNLTSDGLSFDGWHSWAPSGEKVAFTKIVQGSGFRTDIYIVNADGSGSSNLTSKPEYYQYLSWSTDSNQIAFECENGICVMNADGTGRRDLVQNGFFPGVGSPVWSPTSNIIAFAAGAGGDREIFIINSDGTGLQKLTADQRVNDLPIWSPDGTRIAFQSDMLDVYSGDIFIAWRP